MKLLPWMLLAAAAISPDASADNGLVNVSSNHSVSETIDRLESLVKSKELMVSPASTSAAMPPEQA